MDFRSLFPDPFAKTTFAGNVGIGTTNLIALTDVNGTSWLREAAGGNERIYSIKSGGNVGIGTTNPGYNLEVVRHLQRHFGLGKNGILLSPGTGSNWSVFGRQTSPAISGNVGIGITPARPTSWMCRRCQHNRGFPSTGRPWLPESAVRELPTIFRLATSTTLGNSAIYRIQQQHRASGPPFRQQAFHLRRSGHRNNRAGSALSLHQSSGWGLIVEGNAGIGTTNPTRPSPRRRRFRPDSRYGDYFQPSLRRHHQWHRSSPGLLRRRCRKSPKPPSMRSDITPRGYQRKHLERHPAGRRNRRFRSKMKMPSRLKTLTGRSGK